ncbi:uncharacterized protein [Apostichopus japonicus]|uniref:uncharacterized protein isoform X1 n=2 Tax=Stichopus japonicus TaxID=307972 RepID=UPI003AB26510
MSDPAVISGMQPLSIAPTNENGSSSGAKVKIRIVFIVYLILVFMTGLLIVLVISPSSKQENVDIQPEIGPTPDIPATSENKPSTAYNECDRTCRAGDIRTCIFDWEVSYYYTMLTSDTACGNCPNTSNDCSNKGCVTLNGLKRPVVTVNQQVPGPKIIVCKGDTFIVNVTNMLNDMTGITFHWHGLNQFHTPAMDGPSMITQCPIPFATTFTYKIIANEPGTYFWHSHIGSNRADGLAGPIVIREVNGTHRNTYDVDDSNHTVFIQDWMNMTQNTNYVEYQYGVGENKPDFLLINGKGKGPEFKGSFFVPREVFHVEICKRYRMRVISNAFTGCQMQLSIDNHTLLAINMDSYPIDPVPFDALISNAGERFDFILHANQSIGNYWLRLKGVSKNCKTLQELAIIRYMSAPEEDPTAPERSLTTPSRLLNAPERSTVDAPTIIRMINLTSNISFDANQDVNRYYLSLGLENPRVIDPRLRERKLIPQINHITFTFPPVPLLTQHDEVDQSLFCDARVASTWTNCTDIQCRCTQIISVELNQTVELFFFNGRPNGGCHPMHLHGFSYRIVGSGLLNGTYTPADIQALDMNGTFPRLQSNCPPNKDTVCVSHGSYMIIQFIADNPGWWFLHCHLDFHALIGMAMVVRVGTDEDLSGLIPPNFPRCNNFAPPGL